jgi:hypothetical protein
LFLLADLFSVPDALYASFHLNPSPGLNYADIFGQLPEKIGQAGGRWDSSYFDLPAFSGTPIERDP